MDQEAEAMKNKKALWPWAKRMVMGETKASRRHTDGSENTDAGFRDDTSYTDFADIRPEKCRMVDFDRQLNASVTDIYQNEYLSPRSPYTTLQHAPANMEELKAVGIENFIHVRVNVLETLKEFNAKLLK